MTERQKLALEFIKKDIELTFNEFKNGIIKVDILKIDFAKYSCSIFFDDLFINEICQEISNQGYHCRYFRLYSFIDRTILTIQETPFDKKYFDIENGNIIEKQNHGFKKLGYDTYDGAKEAISNEIEVKISEYFWKKIFNIKL